MRRFFIVPEEAYKAKTAYVVFFIWRKHIFQQCQLSFVL